jgi:glycosyltransferase involved in cell wall biosynthesis
MRVLTIINISNVDDIACDSGVIFQRVLAEKFAELGIDYAIVGPDVEAFKQLPIKGARKLYAPMGTMRYSTRFSFDWPRMQQIIEEEAPDVIFNNQVELTTALRSLLVTIDNNHARIVTYCHYPALYASEGKTPKLDQSLNHSKLGLPIVFDILSALMTSDAFVIQSNFAKNLIITAAKYHNIGEIPEIFVIPPPSDPQLSKPYKDTPIASKKILYNHRLYQSYGTDIFLGFAQSLTGLDFELVCSDPMSKRSVGRQHLSNSPSVYKKELARLPQAKVVDGNVPRAEYKRIIQESRLAFAAFRKACVWSMAAIDCMALGVPTIAPNYASYPEFIPSILLFDDLPQATALTKRLLVDDDFWLECSRQCYARTTELSPEAIGQQFYRLFSEGKA